MKKVIAVIFVLGMFTSNIFSFPVKANDSQTSKETEVSIVRAEGLITGYTLSISKSGSTLYINANTRASTTMKTIGFKDIVVEYSANNVDWFEYEPAFDYTKSSASSYYMSSYPISVTNGYYYRVTLNHYAKETGWFGSSQSVPNTSNVVS